MVAEAQQQSAKAGANQPPCDDDEYPWFVSDEATVFDVSTASKAELKERVAVAFGHAATAADLELPLWKLATKMRPPD